MQASIFVGAFDQLFLWIFMKFSQKMPLNVFYTMMQKTSKMTKTQIKGGPASNIDNNNNSALSKSCWKDVT